MCLPFFAGKREHMIFCLWEILGGKGGGGMERFACKTTVVSGEGALDALAQLRCRRMLVVTGAGNAQSGQVQRIFRAAGEPETAYLEDGFPEGTMKRAVEGSRKIADFQPDLVVALGDRSTVDLGKAMTCFSKHSCTLAAVPTAFGAGAEVTGQVILSHNGRRHLLRDEKMRPELAILDSAMTETLSKGQIGEGGFELLAAALEAYTASGGGILRDIHAREGFSVGWAALPAAFSGSSVARRRLQTASVLAGMAADQAALGLCSAMQSSLGTVFGLPRGKAAAIVLPAIIGCNAHAAGRRYAELSRAAGQGGSREEIGIRNLKSGLIRLRRELGLPGTLVQAGVDLRSVWSSGKRIVELTLEDPACRNNPVAVDDFMVRRILEEITGRI